MLGETVRVIVDRPLGSTHPKWKDIRYPVNYGHVEGVLAPDGEGQDVYILGVEVPLEEFVGQVIAVIHRFDDVEEKWVAAPPATKRRKFLPAIPWASQPQMPLGAFGVIRQGPMEQIRQQMPCSPKRQWGV